MTAGAHIDREKQAIIRDGPVQLPKPIPVSVLGWIWPFELEYLYQLAVTLEQQSVPGGILEVGSYRGLSACAMGQAGPITCVDTFSGGEDLPETNILAEFRANVAMCGVVPDIHVGRSQDVLPTLRGPFRLVFIDGSHEYENVRLDIHNGFKLLAPGGALVCDDVVGFEGVQRAALESNLGFRLVDSHRSKMAVAYREL